MISTSNYVVFGHTSGVIGAASSVMNNPADRVAACARFAGVIGSPSTWEGYSLRVITHPWIDRPHGPTVGVVRNFDLLSVLVGGKRIENYASVADLSLVWRPA
jgi:hypothetical protein